MFIIYKLNGYVIIKLIYNWFIYYIDIVIVIYDILKKKNIMIIMIIIW